MNSSNRNFTIFSVLSICFVALFYQHDTGLNVLIFNTLLVIGIQLTQRTFPQIGRLIWLGQMLLAVAYVVNYNHFTMVLLVLNSFLLLGVAIGSNRTVLKNFLDAFEGIGQAFKRWINFFQFRTKRRGLIKLRTFLIPLLFMLLFLVFYQVGSEGFKELTGNWLVQLWEWLSEFNAFTFVLVLFIGLLLSSVVILERIRFEPSPPTTLPEAATLESQHAKRLALEGSITFGILIGLISIVLFYEIRDVWIGFEWKHQLLKPFVHSGTYVLLMSTAVSLFITLFYFKKRYPSHPWTTVLKWLSVIWSVLNIILLISLLYRTGLYIKYFGLAYLRIGVVYFVIAALFGISSVIYAVKQHATRFWLVRTNSSFIYCLLVTTSFFCWDQVIPAYNLTHADRSFVDLKFFKTLSDKSLYYTNLAPHELDSLNDLQRSHLQFVDSAYHQNIGYVQKMDDKRVRFMSEFESKKWMEWNYAEWKTYTHLLEVPE